MRRLKFPKFPRLLPLTIIAMVLLLGQKCFQIAGAAISGQPVASAAVSPAAASAATSLVPPVVNWDSTQPPPAVCPPQTTINPSEVDVLSALRQRAAALDARQAGLDRKQALVDASETNLSAQLAGLQAVEDRLNAISENQSQASDARWQALVATYEAMDPQAAAGIFNGLDDTVLLPVLTRMNSRKAAVILANMSPDKARQATELMAGQTPQPSLAPGLPAASLPAATGQ